MWTIVIAGLLSAAQIIEIEEPAFSTGNQELHAYLLEAGANHPGLKSDYATWLAALERIPQATALDDPMLSYAQFLQSDSNRLRVRLSQSFPWFGTLNARGDAARYAADATLSRFYAQRDHVFKTVKKAYYEYAHLRARLEVTESQTEILEYMEDVERSRFSLGGSGQHDLLRVQIERDKIDDRRLELLQLRAVLSTNLARALGRYSDPELSWPQPLGPVDTPPTRDVVLAEIRADNPQLLALAAQSESREANIEIARKKAYPDFTLGFEGMARKKDADFLSVILSFNIPIWRGKVRAGIAEARYQQDAVEHGTEDLAQTLERAAIRALFDFQDAQRRANLFTESLIPKASQTYESLQSAYSLGTSGVALIDLLESVNALLEFELEGRRATRDMHIAAAELEMLMGGPWDSIE